MKRIKSACLQQTIHFELKEDLERAEALELVKKELAAYKSALDRKHTLYRVEGENALPDGSILLKIKKQYNSYDCGDYLS